VLVTLLPSNHDPGGEAAKEQLRKPVEDLEYVATLNLGDIEIDVDKIQLVED
jgi:hypothetical protein